MKSRGGSDLLGDSHEVWFTVYERAIRAYRRASFQEIGRRRGAYRLAGRACDIILMDYRSKRFESPAPRRLLTGPVGDGSKTGRR